MDIGKWIQRVALGCGIVGLLIGGPIVAETSDGVTAVQMVTPATSHIGDLLTYDLSVTYNDTVALVDVGAAGITSPFAVIKFKKMRQKKAGVNVFRYVATISPFGTGTFTIQERIIKYKVGHQVSSMVVPEIQVDVVSVLTATSNQIDDIKSAPPLASPVGQLGVLVGGFVVIGGGGLVAYLVKRRRDRPEIERIPTVDDRSIEDVALHQIENALLAIEDPLLFYTALSDLLRVYLGARFSIESREMTSHELGMALESLCDPGILKRIARVLHLCDLVKFAKFDPPVEDARIAVEKVRGILAVLAEPKPEVPADEAS